MLIYEFLGHEEAYDYESLGIPAVPAEFTRAKALHYRTVLEAYLTSIPPAPTITLARYRLRFGGKAGRRSRRGYHDGPFISDTKLKKLRKERASRMGKPYHQREEVDNSWDDRQRRDTTRALIEEVETRYPNLPKRDFVRPNKRAEPTVADYFDGEA